MAKIKIAGYVKLAKLWEKNRRNAINYHFDFYNEKFANSEIFDLVDVYIDITGKKNIYDREEMVRLLSDVKKQRIECIYTQTKAYLAANTKDFLYLIKYIYEINENINLITEDAEYNINTYLNEESQKEEMLKLADSYTNINFEDYSTWKDKINTAIKNIQKYGDYKND